MLRNPLVRWQAAGGIAAPTRVYIEELCIYCACFCARAAQKLVALQSSTLWAGQVTPALPAAVEQRSAATTRGSGLHQACSTQR